MAPQVGRTAEAAAGFRAAISVQPDGAEAYYNLGIAYKDQGRHRDSLDAYHAALALRPTFPEASFNAVVVFTLASNPSISPISPPTSRPYLVHISQASFNAGRALQMLTDEPGPLGLLTLTLALPLSLTPTRSACQS